MRLLLALTTAAATVGLAACGGSSSPSSHTTAAGASPSPPSTATTAAPASTAAAPTTTTAPSTPAASGPPICRAGDLRGSFIGGQAATGHGLLGFALHNTSARTCTTYGYPGVLFLAQGGRTLTTVPDHTTQDFFGSLPKPSLTVSPGSTVSFRLGVTHGAASAASCAMAFGLQVIPPNDTSTLRIAIPSGAYECQTATVSPVQPGTSAYP